MYKRKMISKKEKHELSAELLLDMADKTFNYHYDMAKRIENKANMLIVIIGILFTLSAGYLTVDFKMLNYISESKKIAYIALFIINIASYFIGIYFFIKVLNLQNYYLLRYDIFNDSNLKVTKTRMQEYLVGKYREMIIEIGKQNKEKSKYYKLGLTSTFIGISSSFILIFFGFIL